MNKVLRLFQEWLSLLSQRMPTSPANGRRMQGSITARLIELLLFALLPHVAGIVLSGSDPTGLQSGFAWVMVPSVVFAARYGSVWGVSCAAVSTAFINLPLAVYAAASSQHLVLGVGTCLLCLFVGEATSMLAKRHAKAAAENEYLRHRLDVFSTDYHVLKVSHGQLEEYMAGQRLSLREALQRLKPLLSSGPEGARAGQDLMAVFAQFCSVQIAGLYTMSSDGRLQVRAVATHGDMPDLPQFDPLLRLALQKKQLVSIKRDMLGDKHHANSLLAVVPLVDFNERVHGVLAIKDMHFMAFQQENLNLLALLGSFLGNLLTRSAGVEQTPAARFVTELETVVHFARQASVESMLLSMQFESSEQGRAVADFVCQSIRSLDSSLVLQSCERHYSIGLILPLMSQPFANAFTARLRSAVARQFDLSLDHVLQDSQSMRVDTRGCLSQCLAFYSVHSGRDLSEAGELLSGVQGVA